MSATYDPNCVRCRYTRPGATTDHRDHVAPADDMSGTACQAINCHNPAVYVAERKTDRARRVVCDDVACIVAVLAVQGVSNMFDIAEAGR